MISFLERASHLGKEYLDKAISSFYRSAISGVRSGSPGQPFPDDIKMKEESEQVLNELTRFSPAHRLYSSLKSTAESNIARSLKEGEALEEAI